MTEQDNQAEPTAYERMQANINKAKASVERITNKALEDRSLIENMDLDLEELVSDLEGKESELFGSPKEIEEEVEQVLDTDPNSLTFQQMIDAPRA